MATFRSPLPPVAIPTVSLQTYLFQDIENFRSHTALIDFASKRRISYGELHDKVRRLASGLARHGVKHGDVFAILGRNSVEWVLVFLAAIYAGATVTTLNPAYTAGEVRHQLEDSNSRFVFVTLDKVGTVQDATHMAKIKPVIFVSGSSPSFVSLESLLNDDGSNFPRDFTVNPRDDIPVLPYSSGTTGRPKGTALTHRNIIAAVQAILDIGEDAEVNLGLLPFFHSYGMVWLVIKTLASRKTLLVMDRFQPKEFLSALQEYEISIIYIVPPTVIFLSKSPLVTQYDLRHLKTIISGAAPLGGDTIADLHQRLPQVSVIQGYGLTEVVAVGTSGTAAYSRQGSNGVLRPNMEAKIVDVEMGETLGTRQTGELWLKGPNVFPGYWKRPQETENSFSADGWLKTGDVAYFDEDGYIFIVDRIKELIKVKGFQVAPAELEDVLLGHAGIADAAVVGVPDTATGELPRAFIVRRDSMLTAEAVHDYVNKKVAPYKRLRGGIFFVSEIPKSASGKILRRQLRALTPSKL